MTRTETRDTSNSTVLNSFASRTERARYSTRSLPTGRSLANIPPTKPCLTRPKPLPSAANPSYWSLHFLQPDLALVRSLEHVCPDRPHAGLVLQHDLSIQKDLASDHQIALVPKMSSDEHGKLAAVLGFPLLSVTKSSHVISHFYAQLTEFEFAAWVGAEVSRLGADQQVIEAHQKDRTMVLDTDLHKGSIIRGRRMWRLFISNHSIRSIGSKPCWSRFGLC